MYHPPKSVGNSCFTILSILIYYFFDSIKKGNGYKTGYVGKWHLSGEEKPGFDIDREFGFQFNKYRYNRGHWKFFEDAADGSVNVYTYDDKDKFTGRLEKNFATDFLFDRGLEFIQESIDQEKPFAMMFSIPGRFRLIFFAFS